MSTLDFTALGDFAGAAPEPPAQRALITAESTYRPASVLAFDQSLGNCGYVHVQTLAGLTVVECGVLKANPALNLRSNVDMLTAHDHLVTQIIHVVRNLNITADLLERMEWVHEMPPHMGKVAGNGASSLLAAAAVRFAARAVGAPITVISAQTVKKALTGSAKAEKPKVRAAIDALPVVGPGGRPKNEHTREALGLAVTYLREG